MSEDPLESPKSCRLLGQAMITTLKLGACEDVTECKCVENVITMLSHYHYWNEEQLKKNPEHSSIDYSAYYISDSEQEEDEDEEDQDNNLHTNSNGVVTPRMIHTQLTKSSASMKHLSTKYENIVSEFMDDPNYTAVSLLNDFYHCVERHCLDDREFEWIYMELSKENGIKSTLSKSNNILHRHNYSRDIVYEDIELMKKLYYGYYESTDIHQFEILDKIYIHFLHSYDFGFRLEPNYKLQIESDEEQRQKQEEKSETAPEINIDKTFGVVAEKLAFLRMNLTRFPNLKARFDKSNRFVTNYNNAMLLNAEFNKTVENVVIRLDTATDAYLQDEADQKSGPALTNRTSSDNGKSTPSQQAKEALQSLNALATIQGKSNEALEADAHSIGKRWHYSKNLKDNMETDTINGGNTGDWYLETKYKNIKRELLDNQIYSISMNAWIFNYDYAMTLNSTNKAKHMVKAMGDRWKSFYDRDQDFKDLPTPTSNETKQDKEDEKNIFQSPKITHSADASHRMTINHILAVLFYCNFNKLSRYFRATFISKDDENESMRTWKLRHSEYANWGRLMRDAIEDYGSNIQEGSLKIGAYHVMRFYHGLDGHRFVFNTTMIRFCSPISTSTSYNIIQQYIQPATASGIMLECKEYSKYLRFFNCDWLSNASNENECIFCGGDWPMKINSILDHGVSSYNYRYYLVAINIIQDLIRGEFNHEVEVIDKKVKHAFNQIFSSRLWMRDAIPKYIDKMFDKYCDNLGKSIEINCEYIDLDTRGYLAIKSSFIDENENDRIKFDVLCCVFSNVQIFKFLTYRLCNETFDYLCTFLGENKHQSMYDSKLKYIIFAAPNEVNLKCKTVIKLYKKKFASFGWFVEYQKKDQFGQPVLLLSDHKLKMTDCLIM